MKTRAIVVAAVAALLGCSDSSGPSITLGTITFTFTGAGGGTFTVSAAAPAPGSEPPPSVAAVAGNIDASTGLTSVVGMKPAVNNARDVVAIGMTRTTVGASLVDPECGELLGDCSSVMFLKGFDTEGESFGTWCMLTSGTLAITEITATRVKGTFSGTGICYDAAFNETAFTITNGTFDVTLVAEL